ncbi:prostate stem cell antigen-like [Gouania willdenowi]|uniref:Prostate stem cell antigen-like n=1 Tax=Gouania willdenowi TaxID=441366 RepID=A0A8C5N301_GOUWI|nr:prostate stem cell antigen-like [Gouania willdenowi]
MNKVVLLLQAFGFCFALSQALMCYECKIGIADLCITKETTCEVGEHCFSGEGKAVGFLPLKMKGCLKTDKCNLTRDESFPFISNSSVYSMTKTCCETNLCNAAPGAPGTSGISLVITAISALLAANALI